MNDKLNETVSVVIPYSPEHTPDEMLEEAKESAEKQDVDTKIIVIEDTELRGPAWARNRGLERSETRFVAFLDADDLWKQNKLRRQLEKIKQTEAGICIEEEEMDFNELIEGLLTGSVVSVTSSILIDTKKVDVKFNEELNRFEDHLFVIQAAKQGDICFCEDLTIIRKHDEGLSANENSLSKNKARVEYAEILSRTVPESKSYINEYLRKANYGVGRSMQRQGKSLAALSYFFESLRYEFCYKTLGVILLTPVFAAHTTVIHLGGRMVTKTMMNHVDRMIQILREDGFRSFITSFKKFMQKNAHKFAKNVKIRLIYIQLKIKYGRSTPYPYKIINIDPNEIQYVYPSADSQELPPYGVRSGNWDLQKNSFDGIISTGLEQRFVDNMNWKETEYYQTCIDRLDSDEYLTTITGHEQTTEGLMNYLKDIDNLYESIQENGFKPPGKIDKLPVVHIGRNGDFLLVHGAQRTVIAKILELNSIPARVRLRHEDWQEFRHDLYNKKKNFEVNKKAKNNGVHPDLKDII